MCLANFIYVEILEILAFKLFPSLSELHFRKKLEVTEWNCIDTGNFM